MIVVDTEKYRASHGQAPKGKGAWAFETRGAASEMVKKVISVPGLKSFTQAKVEAVAYLREKGFSGIIHVAP